MQTTRDTRPILCRLTATATAILAVVSAFAAVVPDAAHAAPSAPRTCATSAAPTYTVASGDGWATVATSTGVSTSALLQANGATASAALYPGDVLCLPAGATATPKAPAASCSSKRQVSSGDSWATLAAAAGVTMSTVLGANNATTDTVLHPGDTVCLPPGAAPVSTANPCISKRTVSAGDSWYVIARSSGVPLDALYAANKARGSTSLQPGQSVCLPAVGYGRELRSLLLHVAPVRGACRFANSWMAPRGGRYHVGTDLISPTGTPVIAVVDGTLTKQTKGSPVSGNAWWLTGSSGTYFFYAHMSAFAGDLKVGSKVHAGDVIGYVGATGNAVSPHLHFEIHPYGGGPVNPYDSIWMLGGCRLDPRYEQTPLS